MGNVNRRLVSVAVPCYGAPPDVGSAAARMLRQRYPGVELAVSNHGSNNESAAIIACQFHRSFHKTGGRAHGTRYSLASFLPTSTFASPPRLIENCGSAGKPI